MDEVPADDVQSAFNLLVKKMREHKPITFRQVRVPKRKLEAALDVSTVTTTPSNTSCRELTIEERFSLLASACSSTEENLANTSANNYLGLYEDVFGSSINRQIYLNSLHLPTSDGQALELDRSQFTNLDSECPGKLDPDTMIINQRFSALAASYGVCALDTMKQDNLRLNSLISISSEESLSKEPQNLDVFTDNVPGEVDIARNDMESQEVELGAIHQENGTNSEEYAQIDNGVNQTNPAPKEQHQSGDEKDESMSLNEDDCQAKVHSVSTEQFRPHVDNDHAPVVEKQADCTVPDPICVSSDEAYDSDTSGILNETMDSMKKKMTSQKSKPVTKLNSTLSDVASQVECSEHEKKQTLRDESTDIKDKDKDNQPKMDKSKDSKSGMKEFQAMRAKIWNQQIDALNQKRLINREKYKEYTSSKVKDTKMKERAGSTKSKEKIDKRKQESQNMDTLKQKHKPDKEKHTRRSSETRTSIANAMKRIPSRERSKVDTHKERIRQRTLGAGRELLEKRKPMGEMKTRKTVVTDHTKPHKDHRTVNGNEIQRRRKEELKASYKSTRSVKDCNKTYKEKLRDRSSMDKLKHSRDNIQLLENENGNCSDEDFCPEKLPKSFASLGKAQQINRLKQLKPAWSKPKAGKGVKLNDTVLATKNLDTLSSLDQKAKTVVNVDPAIPERVGVLLELTNPVHAGGIWKSLNDIVSE